MQLHKRHVRVNILNVGGEQGILQTQGRQGEDLLPGEILPVLEQDAVRDGPDESGPLVDLLERSEQRVHQGRGRRHPGGHRREPGQGRRRDRGTESTRGLLVCQMSKLALCHKPTASSFLLFPPHPHDAAFVLTCDSWDWVGHAEKQGDIGDLELGKKEKKHGKPIQDLHNRLVAACPPLTPFMGRENDPFDGNACFARLAVIIGGAAPMLFERNASAVPARAPTDAGAQL